MLTADTHFTDGYMALASDLNVCSKRGLSERFDSTIGAGTVLMPFGGKHQKTPIQAMVHKISVEKKHTDDCSFMSWGYNPFITEKSPYHGAYLAVVESVAKLIAAGASFEDVYLTFQEYFEKLGKDSRRWGKPLSALLGAFEAQKNLGIGMKHAHALNGQIAVAGSPIQHLTVADTDLIGQMQKSKACHCQSIRILCAAGNDLMRRLSRGDHVKQIQLCFFQERKDRLLVSAMRGIESAAEYADTQITRTRH